MQTKEITLPHQFKPRKYQLPILAALDQGKKRIVACLHRGGGKDLMALNWIIKTAIQKPAVYLHCFPNFSQGKKAIWNSVHNTDEGEPMGYLDHIPTELIKSKDSSEMRITFINGSVYCIMGMDGKNANRARGMNPSCVIMSEYAFMDSSAWYTIEPRVSQNHGTAIFLSTPNGQNHFYDIYNYSVSEEGKKNGWFGTRITLEDTQALPITHIEELRAQGYPEDFIQQEYYCSFNRGAQGSYYGKQIQDCRDDGRICDINIDRTLPCFTGWDIGIGDSNAIWIGQQLNNGKLVFVDFYENHGVGLEHYINYLDQFRTKHNIVWSSHYVPHDMRNREYGSGTSRLEIAATLGYKMTPIVKDGRAYGFEEGVQCVRATLPNCVFNKDSCKFGIKCLDLYRKKYNETLKVYFDEPCHDQYSHGCFIENTSISTHEGKKQIQNIKIGDLVKTPNGYRKVTHLYKYKAKKLVNIKTSKGRSIWCTGNHKIFSGKGLVCADELLYTNTLIDESFTGNRICKSIIGYHGERTNLGFRDIFLLMKKKQEYSLMDLPIHGMGFISNLQMLKDYIEKFGNIMAMKFQRIITFITLTEIHETIQLKICNASIHPNIQKLVPKLINGLEAKKIKDNLGKIQKNLELGMIPKRVGNGILNMERIHGRKENGLLLIAKTVVKKNLHLILNKLNSALLNVPLLKDFQKRLITLSKNVKSAIKNSMLINISLKEHVQEVVAIHLEEEIDVYDFEVEHDHCYYAEGILVSNSDAFRMACLGIKELGDSRTLNPEKIREMRQKYLGY